MTPRSIKRADILEERRWSRRSRKIRRSNERQRPLFGVKRMTPDDIRRDIVRQLAWLDRDTAVEPPWTMGDSRNS